MRDIQPDLKYQDNKRLKSTLGSVVCCGSGDRPHDSKGVKTVT